jgi:imidazolonepropionase-like amidohydrolase
MDQSSPPLFLAHGAYYVPTLVTYSALAEHGRAAGLPEASHKKIFDVLDAGLRALEMADIAGVPIAYGTDLLGTMHTFQTREFKIRSEVQQPASVVRAATTVGAEVVRMQGQVGVIAPGAFADLLIVDGNPLEDIGVLADPEEHLLMVMKAGQIYRDRLA